MAVNQNNGAGDVSPFLDIAALAGLESMRFSTRRRVDGNYSGRHVAQRQGGAGQYIDSREYAPGDDLRRLDWPAMGRTQRAYVRLYQDETNLACMMVADASGSMHFGASSPSDSTGSKLSWCQHFATALSHLITLGRDQVGMIVAHTDDASADRETTPQTSYFAPTASPRQTQLLHQSIAGLTASGQTPLGETLQDLFVRVRRRGVLLVISDFLVEPFDEVLRAIRQFRGRGWETVAVHVVHPAEQRLPDGIAFRFTGLEGEGIVDCRPSEIREVYQRAFAEHCQRVRDGLLSAGCDYRMFSTGASYLEAVRSFMVARSA